MSLQRLPVELIENVVFSLSLYDCDNLQIAYELPYKNFVKSLVHQDPMGSEVCNITPEIAEKLRYGDIVKVCKKRYDYVLYIGHFFDSPSELLICMMLCNVVLLGSRALGFFDPESCDIESNLTFCMEKRDDKIFTFMKYMEGMGTKWYTALEWFEMKLNCCTKDTIVTADEIEHLLEYINDEDVHVHHSVDAYTVIAIREIHNVLSEGLETSDDDTDVLDYDMSYVATNKSGNKVTLHIRDFVYLNRDDIRHLQIVHGSGKFKGVSLDVKLEIVESNYHLNPMMDRILGVNMSILQCAIGGTAAICMYDSHIENKVCTLWDLSILENIPDAQINGERVKTYERKGYHIIQGKKSIPIGQQRRRMIGDLDSRIIHSSIHPGFDDAYMKDKTRSLFNYSWIQEASRPVLDKSSESVYKLSFEAGVCVGVERAMSLKIDKDTICEKETSSLIHNIFFDHTTAPQIELAMSQNNRSRGFEEYERMKIKDRYKLCYDNIFEYISLFVHT